ncbi:MAG: T9SS type A sorting domain-containing protein, partial [Bacteroidota bacterium]
IGIDNYTNTKAINVYPNPVTNELIIEIKGNTQTIQFEISNSIGQLIYKSKMIEKTVIQTSAFPSGIYFIKLENGKIIEFKKIIKE